MSFQFTYLTSKICFKVLKNIITRLIKALTKKGVIFNEQNPHLEGLNNEPLDHDPFAQVQASSVSYRFAFGPSKGKKTITLNSINQLTSNTDPFVVNNSGFSLHAGVATDTNQRGTQLFPRDEPQELYSGLFHHIPQEIDQFFNQDQN